MAGAQAVAGKVDLRVPLALAHVVVGTLQQLNGRPGTQVAAADADDHKHVGTVADPTGSALNAQDLIAGLPGGQIQPAQEIVARAGAVHELCVGSAHFLFHSQKIGQSDLAPDIGDVNLDHM